MGAIQDGNLLHNEIPEKGMSLTWPDANHVLKAEEFS